MEKTPSPFSSLPGRRVSFSVRHTNGSSVHLPSRFARFPFPSPRRIRRAVFISPSPAASVGSLLDSPFYILPTPSPRYLNPRRPARHSGGPQHQPVGSRPCFASFRFVSSLVAFPCTSMHRVAESGEFREDRSQLPELRPDSRNTVKFDGEARTSGSLKSRKSRWGKVSVSQRELVRGRVISLAE